MESMDMKELSMNELDAVVGGFRPNLTSLNGYSTGSPGRIP